MDVDRPRIAGTVMVMVASAIRVGPVPLLTLSRTASSRSQTVRTSPRSPSPQRQAPADRHHPR
jgi:hypothetical protein